MPKTLSRKIFRDSLAEPQMTSQQLDGQAAVHDAGSEPPPKVPERRRLPRPMTMALGALALLGLLLIAALAPAAHLAAEKLPLRPDDLTPSVDGSFTTGTTALRQLPIGLPSGQRITTIQDVYPFAVAALGEPGARALTGVLTSPEWLVPLSAPDSHNFAYPYHYAVLEPILASAPADQLRRNATALAAALIQLDGRKELEHSQAAPVAFALLDRIRGSGGCDAQLDLLLLVAGDYRTSMEALLNEYQNSSVACPNDPTPGWITGQAQMRRLYGDMEPRPARVDSYTRTSIGMALGTFQVLAGRFPRDTAVITGLGDAYLRAGLLLLYSNPFTARDDLQQAVGQYNRAAELGDRHNADLGRARAFIALGEPERAIKLATRAVDDSPHHPGVALEVLLAAQQAAHHFDSAQQVAQRLERSASTAYPDAVALYPAPTSFDRGLPFDAALPLSTGAETLAPLQDDLTPSGGRGGGIVEDLGFIPAYRDNDPMTDTLTDCPSLAWRRDAIVSGHAASALADWPAEFTTSGPKIISHGCGWGSTDDLRLIAELAAQQSLTEKSSLTTDQLKLIDEWQNMLRWAGDLPGARNLTGHWEQLDTGNPTPALRYGEVAFLQNDFNEAAAQFGEAARRARLQRWNDDLAVARAQLGRGAALLKAQRDAEAVALLRPLESLGTQGYAYHRAKEKSAESFDASLQYALVSYNAAVQLGNYESASGNLRGAIDDYNVAASWTDVFTEHSFRPEVVYNNVALAYLGVGATGPAKANVDRAIQADPSNPVFLMTAGFVAERAGDSERAIDFNRRALRSDPGAFAAANDLGVELARRHDYAAAESALRRAVGANPDYALGWFNLGVLESRRGPGYLLASQGAFGKAFALDGTLKDRRQELTIDGKVYRTALDLSKPIPPRWSFAQTQKAAPGTTAGLLTVVALGAGLARASSNRGGEFAKRWLEPIDKRLSSIRGPAWLQPPIWALAATVVSFCVAYLRHVGGLIEILAYCLGITVLAGAAMFARVAITARARVSAEQTSWLPGMIFGLATGAVGITWAPLPVTKADEDFQPLHLAAPLTAALIAVMLFIESAWVNVPLTQAFAVAALIMAGSLLVPVKPLDGANLGKAGAFAAAGVVGGAILVILGVV
ncbi:MAG: hypothetical protein CK429_02590 [Mycobacterium sp.]|nr:MAG: hypothetical protein CK429_02590 [Mycobacterium sp.]